MGCKEQKCYYATVEQIMPRNKNLKYQEYNTMKQPMCKKKRRKISVNKENLKKRETETSLGK